jgi:hypothetical protein
MDSSKCVANFDYYEVLFGLDIWTLPDVTIFASSDDHVFSGGNNVVDCIFKVVLFKTVLGSNYLNEKIKGITDPLVLPGCPLKLSL